MFVLLDAQLPSLNMTGDLPLLGICTSHRNGRIQTQSRCWQVRSSCRRGQERREETRLIKVINASASQRLSSHLNMGGKRESVKTRRDLRRRRRPPVSQSCGMVVAWGCAASPALMASCSGTRRSSNSLWAQHAQAVIWLDSPKDCGEERPRVQPAPESGSLAIKDGWKRRHPPGIFALRVLSPLQEDVFRTWLIRLRV